jgi:hypothetical protein
MQICIFLLTEVLPIIFSLTDQNLSALSDSPPLQLQVTQQPRLNGAPTRQGGQVLHPHDFTRYSFSGSEDISNMIWLESQPGAGGGALPLDPSGSSLSRGRVSLSDPYPPPPNALSPNIHQWKRAQSRFSADLGSPPGGSSLISPRSSVTSEHSPRVAGGWLWWLGI